MSAAAHKNAVTLHIARELDLPVEVVTARLAFLGTSGGGKTFGAMKLAELVLTAGVQMGAIDPQGVWWGLRSSADGKSAGFPVVVFGGLHADVPITPSGGGAVADLVVERRISFVLDVSDFTIGEMHQFVGAFAERLFERQRKAPAPLLLFWEEAHTFLPQERSDRGPAVNVMINRCERCVRQGRSHGIGNVLISQAPQAIRKASLNLVDLAFVFRTGGKHERKAIKDWFDSQSVEIDVDEVLPKLETGRAYVVSPFLLEFSGLVKVLPKDTFDSSATPKVGEHRVVPKVLAPVDIQALRDALEHQVEEAEADDPKALRRRIADLEKKLAAGPAAAKVEIKTVEVPVVGKEECDRLNHICRDFLERAIEVTRAAAEVTKAADGIRAELAKVHNHRAEAPRRPMPASAASTPPPGGDAPGLKRGAREMLRILVAAYPVALTKVELGVLVGMKHSSGTFGDYLSKLRSTGLVTYSDAGDQVATDAGVKLMGHSALPSSTQVVQLWKAHFKAGARKMLDAVVASEGLSREQLGTAVSMEPTSGTFGDYLSHLRSAGLITNERGVISAAPAIFLGDR